MAQGWPVYIVDGDEAARASLAALLSANGHTDVRGFASGDRFLDACHTLPPGCLLLDIGMPGRDGLGVLQEMDRCNIDLAAVMITGAADIRTAVASMKAGAIDVLEKPYEPEALLEALRVAAERLDRMTALSARVAAARMLTDRLSRRETEVLQGVARGDLNKVIAHRLGISPRTIEIHRANLMNKLGARSLPEALRIALAAGVIDEEPD